MLQTITQEVNTLPTSYHQAISTVMDLVVAENPASLLDLGVGYGKYGVLCREVMDIRFKRYHRQEWEARIDGVEGFAAYRNPLHDYAYNQIYYARIEDVLERLPIYDVVLMVDVLEHFPRPQGEAIIGRALAHANKAVIISTPVAPAPQADLYGNELERHVSLWRPADFRRYVSDVGVLRIESEGALIVRLRPEKQQGSRKGPFPPDFRLKPAD